MKMIILVVPTLLLIGCGGGGKTTTGGAGGDGGGGSTTATAPLTAGEKATVNSTATSALEGLFLQLINQFSRSPVAQKSLTGARGRFVHEVKRLVIVKGAVQGAFPCPGGGQLSGGGSGTLDTDTGFVKGQGSGSALQCLSADGSLRLSGSVSGQGVGTCPGAINISVTGNVEVSRRGAGGGFVPVQQAFGILFNRNTPC